MGDHARETSELKHHALHHLPSNIKDKFIHVNKVMTEDSPHPQKKMKLKKEQNKTLPPQPRTSTAHHSPSTNKTAFQLPPTILSLNQHPST